MRHLGRSNDAATQAYFALIEYGALPRRDGSLRPDEKNGAPFAPVCQKHILIWLTVAKLRGQGDFTALGAWRITYPGDLLYLGLSRKQHRVILALGDDQNIPFQLLVDHKPASAIAMASNAKTPPLAQGIVHQAIVPTQNLPINRNDLTRLRRQKAGQKIFKVPFPDEANAG